MLFQIIWSSTFCGYAGVSKGGAARFGTQFSVSKSLMCYQRIAVSANLGFKCAQVLILGLNTMRHCLIQEGKYTGMADDILLKVSINLCYIAAVSAIFFFLIRNNPIQIEATA